MEHEAKFTDSSQLYTGLLTDHERHMAQTHEWLGRRKTQPATGYVWQTGLHGHENLLCVTNLFYNFTDSYSCIYCQGQKKSQFSALFLHLKRITAAE